MYYYKKNNELLEKYEVNYDLDEINAFKNNLIETEAKIYHNEENLLEEPKSSEGREIRNLKKGNIASVRDIVKPNGRDIEVAYYYQYTYDEVKYPSVVKSINKILAGDGEELTSVMNKDIEKESIKIELSIQIDEDTVALEEKKDEIKSLEHYKTLQNMIKMTKVASIPLSMIEEVYNFFNQDPNLEIDKATHVK